MGRLLLFSLLTLLAAVLSLSVVLAEESNLPEGIVAILQGQSWDGYEIGRVNYGLSLQDYHSLSCYCYDQGEYAAGFVLMHSEDETVLCVFEKTDAGEWYLKEKSVSAVLQNGRIPAITAETYEEFAVSYLDQDRQTDLEILFKRRNDDWYVSEIFLLNSSHQAISIIVHDEKLVISEETNGWKERTATSAIPCAFGQFSISSFPVTEEKVMEQTQ